MKAKLLLWLAGVLLLGSVYLPRRIVVVLIVLTNVPVVVGGRNRCTGIVWTAV